MAEFIELHARSAFSFHRGASHPEDMIRQAAKLGMSAMALTDRDGVYGSARAHHAAQELLREHRLPFRALVGAEVTLDDESALPVLMRTQEGYQHLCQLLTKAKLRGLSEKTARENPHLNARKQGRVIFSEWEPYAEGMIALTGDADGFIQRALRRGDRKAAHGHLTSLIRTFGAQNVMVTIQRYHRRGEAWLHRQLIDLANAHGLLLIASNSPRAATPQGRRVLDAFTCLLHHVNLDEAGTLLALNAEDYLNSPQLMAALFADHPEFLTNTLRVADRIEFTLENLGYQFPQFPTPLGQPASSFLREQTYRGAKDRYSQITPQIRKQLDHELALIAKLGFCGYFLIVQDIVHLAREREILVQGRGSAANSAVCYCLGITAVDAIKKKLLFERFLSEGRNTWPDIDLDLPSGDRREAIIQAVYEKYAPLGAAMTANVITYRGRSTMREMGKVLDVPESILNRFSEVWGTHKIQDQHELRARMQEAGLSAQHPRLPTLVHLYQAVYSLPRHLGQHSGGMIISDNSLAKIVPLENATMENRRIVQWDKDDCEDLGIIKVDLLGLGMLAAMQDT
ncbi:MAG: PHP domain-containing protein, partial [Verrucomicrobiota bacterium]